MRAAQYISPGQVELVETSMPVPAAGQVTVRVAHVTLCGSDLHELYDNPASSYPFPPGFSGHECVGVIEESDQPGFRRGDRALIIPSQSNALAEYLTTAPGRLIPLPDGISDDVGVLAQQLGTVIWCCRKLDNVLGKVVVVVGQGPAGLLFTTLLSSMGARVVIGLDIVDARLAVARRLGAHHAINVRNLDAVAVVSDLTSGQMADVVVEAVGKEETINLSPDLARERGELALFGVPKRHTFPFAYEKFLRRQLRTVTSAHTQAEPGLHSFRLAVDLIAQGRIDVAPLISHRLPFHEVRRAFHLAETKEEGAVKVLLDFDRVLAEL